MYKSIRTVQFAFICVRGMSCLLTYNLCTQREYFVKEKRRNMTKKKNIKIMGIVRMLEMRSLAVIE